MYPRSGCFLVKIFLKDIMNNDKKIATSLLPFIFAEKIICLHALKNVACRNFFLKKKILMKNQIDLHQIPTGSEILKQFKRDQSRSEVIWTWKILIHFLMTIYFCLCSTISIIIFLTFKKNYSVSSIKYFTIYFLETWFLQFF